MECRGRERAIVACYREFEPPVALRRHVRALFSFTAHVEAPSQARRITCEFRFCAEDLNRSPIFAPTFADANASVVFDLGSALHPDGRWGKDAGAGGRVIGAMSVVHVSHHGEVPAMVGAYLRPARVSRFAQIPASELRDRIVPVEDVWAGSRAREMAEELTTLNEAERLDRLEVALLERLDDRREAGVAAMVPRLAAWITERSGRLTVEALAHDAGVSRQRLTRVFQEHVGVSPKLYCRLARFQSALAYAENADIEWARAAVDLGYADQSHMIAEFREFSSLTPHKLASERWFHPFIERAKARDRQLRHTERLDTPMDASP